LGFHRGALDKSSRYFGPFPHSGAVRESINLLQRVFRLRTCEDSVFGNRSRPCLLHQIRRCSAPCVGLIDRAAYGEDVNNARLLVEGRSDEVMKLLSTRMQDAAESLEFENAAIFRDQIQSLAKMSQRQYADTASGQDADVIALAGDHGVVCVNLVMIRGGRHLGDRSLFPHNAQDRAPEEVLQAFLDQHYLERPVPPVVVAGAPVDALEVEAFLGARAGHRVHVVVRPNGDRRAWLDMAEKNAQLALKQRLSEQSTQEGRLARLREALGLADSTARIECFDVSHTQGEAAVASCVVYDRFDLRRGEYRRYNINGVTPGDDYAAMKQALSRRYARVAGGEGVVPDLILIDGGKGQVSAATTALAELGVNDVALVGVAKGPERKAGLEELWVPGRADAIQLPADHPGLHLIQQIRDEAHRFAITGHRARRAKARVTSTLEGIGGIGAKRRRELLARFGGLKGVMGASVEDLAQAQGISRKLAEKIYRELHAA
jgi:excinuclease ABC subunit C